MNLLVQHTQIPNLPKQVSARKPAKKTSVFYVNDIHGQIPKMERLVSASDHAKLYAQQNNADFLKLCCGDTFIGKDEERNAVAAAYLNIADFDAQAIGNHEFDMPASKCGALLKDTKTAVLAMNLNFPDNQSDLEKKVMRSAVAESEDGEKYGLIGIQPPDLELRTAIIKKKAEQLLLVRLKVVLPTVHMKVQNFTLPLTLCKLAFKNMLAVTFVKEVQTSHQKD